MEKTTAEKSLPRVSSKSTKTELLDAYKAALEKLERANVQKSGEPSKAPEKQMIEKVSGYTAETIIKGLADLQVGIGKSLSDLAQKLIVESEKLSELRKAIEVASNELKQLHDIEVNVNTLASLIDAQVEQKAVFEQEMARKRDEWKKEQMEHEAVIKERDAQVKKQREREEEEYKYTTSLKRKKEMDEYNTEKAELQKQLAEDRQKFEKEVSDRTAVFSAKEAEYAELKKKVERFPTELEEAVKKADQAARTAVKQQLEFETKMTAKEVEADRRVAELKIANLESNITKQQAQIEELSKHLQLANQQVQEMALKAIESTSGLKSRQMGDASQEQSRSAGSK